MRDWLMISGHGQRKWWGGTTVDGNAVDHYQLDFLLSSRVNFAIASRDCRTVNRYKGDIARRSGLFL